MKKELSLILAVLIFVLCGCTDTTKQEAVSQNILFEYLSNIETFDVPTREFGEPTSFVDMTKEMVVGILYPETEYEFLNNAITSWSKEALDYYKKEYIQNARKAEAPAELTVDYENFCVAQNIVSIKMKGVFHSPSLAHPIDVFKTFNANTKDKKLLTVKDIFTEDGLTEFAEKIKLTVGISDSSFNEDITNHFILQKDGIEIILNRGDYLPMSEGTKFLFFSYSDIKNMLKDSFVLKPEAPKEEAETPKKENPVSVTASKNEVSGKKMIALTFDDGPSIHTERLLDIFAKHGGKGTFFVIGSLVDNRPSTVKRIADEGHELANHGWDHRQLTTLDDKSIKDQIMMTKAKIYSIAKVDTVIMRPPYGSCNSNVKAIGKDLGVSFVNWSVDTLDWKTKNARSIYLEIMKNVKNGSIILCHDLYKSTVDAMELVIPKLVEEGFELVTVTDLMSGSLEAGKIYYKK